MSPSASAQRRLRMRTGGRSTREYLRHVYVVRGDGLSRFVEADDTMAPRGCAAFCHRHGSPAKVRQAIYRWHALLEMPKRFEERTKAVKPERGFAENQKVF